MVTNWFLGFLSNHIFISNDYSDASYVNIQVGYTMADIVSIGIFGVMIYMIAQRKSDAGA